MASFYLTTTDTDFRLPPAVEAATIARVAAVGVWTSLVTTGGFNQISDPQFATAGFLLDAVGCVHLRGMLYTPATTQTTIATLPVGARPAHVLRLATLAGDNSAELLVYANGTIIWQAGTTGSWLSLDGVSFMAGE